MLPPNLLKLRRVLEAVPEEARSRWQSDLLSELAALDDAIATDVTTPAVEESSTSEFLAQGVLGGLLIVPHDAAPDGIAGLDLPSLNRYRAEANIKPGKGGAFDPTVAPFSIIRKGRGGKFDP